MPSQLKTHDELSSIDSEIKIEQLLNDIKVQIDECKNEQEVKLIAKANPHLAPIMISYYGSYLITKFPSISLGDLFNCNYDFNLFFFNSSIWAKLLSDDKAKLHLSTNIPVLQKVKEGIDLALANQDKNAEQLFISKTRTEDGKNSSPSF